MPKRTETSGGWSGGEWGRASENKGGGESESTAGGGKRTKEGERGGRRWPRDVAHEEVRWKWKVDLRTRPILTQSSFSLVYVAARSSVHAAACVCVRDTGDSNNAPSIKRAHLLPVALNRQIDKGHLSGGGKKKQEERRKRAAARKIGERGRRRRERGGGKLGEKLLLSSLLLLDGGAVKLAPATRP